MNGKRIARLLIFWLLKRVLTSKYVKGIENNRNKINPFPPVFIIISIFLSYKLMLIQQKVL